MLAPRRSLYFGGHRTPAPLAALKIRGRGERLSDTPTAIPALVAHPFVAPVRGREPPSLRRGAGSTPIPRASWKGALLHPAQPGDAEDDDSQAPSQPAPTLARAAGPARPRGAHCPLRAPAIEGRGAGSPPRPGKGRGLTWPSPRHALGFAPLATAGKEPGTRPEQRRPASGLACRTRHSSPTAGPGAARSRHLPPLKHRRRHHRRSCSSGREKTAQIAHAPGPGAEDTRAQSRQRDGLAWGGLDVAPCWEGKWSGAEILPSLERRLGERSWSKETSVFRACLPWVPSADRRAALPGATGQICQ